MGYSIRVDHSKFQSVADSIDTYLSKYSQKMRQANEIVDDLMVSWQGTDAQGFYMKWKQVNSRGSLSYNMQEALENYAEFMRYAANQYRNAQASAINRARWL